MGFDSNTYSSALNELDRILKKFNITTPVINNLCEWALLVRDHPVYSTFKETTSFLPDWLDKYLERIWRYIHRDNINYLGVKNVRKY